MNNRRATRINPKIHERCFFALMAAAALAVLAGCTAIPLRGQQIWRSATNHEYPSAPVGTPEFEAALDNYTQSASRPAYDCDLLQNGDEAYPAMLKLIASAQHSISLETYIVEDDETTDIFFAALIDAAKRGVRVRVLADAAGFHRSLIANLTELTENGVEARVFNPYFMSWTVVRGNNRDHRKILVVDGVHAILGGINLSNEQRGDGVSGWRDTSLRVSGPAAADAERVFAQSWRQAGRGWAGKNLPVSFLNPIKQTLDAPFISDEAPPAPREYTPSAPSASNATVRVIASTPDSFNSNTYDMAILGIWGARERIDIACAYFVPPLGMRRALFAAAARGVRIRLLLPEVTDVKLVREMGMRYYDQMLEAGMEVYEWPHPILHCKTMAVDGKWLIVGSANMDSRSYFLNYEACLALSCPATAREAHEQFDRDIRQAKQMTLEKWRSRGIRRKLPWLLTPLAGQY